MALPLGKVEEGVGKKKCWEVMAGRKELLNGCMWIFGPLLSLLGQVMFF